MDTDRCELGTGGLGRFVSSAHRDAHLIFSSCNTYQVSMLTPYVSTIKQLQNFRNIFLSWMTVNVTPKPSRRLSHIDECSHTNLGIRLGKPHTMEFSSIYKDFSNVFSGTKYTVDWSGCVCVCVHAHACVCVCVCERERERERESTQASKALAKIQGHNGIYEKGGLDKEN